MKEQLDLLYQLQTLDSDIARLRQAIADLDDGTRARRKYQAARHEWEAKAEEVRQLETASRDRELELKSTDADLKAKSGRAYGGTVADTKELASLERKIEELTRRRDRLETEILALIEELETARTAAAELEEKALKLKTLWRKLVRAFEASRDKIEGDIAGITTQREETAARLEAGLLAEYETLRGKLEGVAVAGIEGNMCTACRTVLPTVCLSGAKQGKAVVKCQNCKRILFPSNAW
jgi:hypothetical protein